MMPSRDIPGYDFEVRRKVTFCYRSRLSAIFMKHSRCETETLTVLLLCRKKRDLEEEEAEGASSGEDEFYDRTMETKKKRSKAAAHVEDAASLYGRKVCCLRWLDSPAVSG